METGESNIEHGPTPKKIRCVIAILFSYQEVAAGKYLLQKNIFFNLQQVFFDIENIDKNLHDQISRSNLQDPISSIEPSSRIFLSVSQTVLKAYISL